MAATILFLASHGGTFYNEQIMYPDGGMRPIAQNGLHRCADNESQATLLFNPRQNNLFHPSLNSGRMIDRLHQKNSCYFLLKKK